jgi:hypothetical protein
VAPPILPTLVAGVALALVIGLYLANRGDPEQTNRPVTVPAEQEGPSNMKIIDREQVIDIDTFDQKDSPLWPLIEEFRKARLRGEPTGADLEFAD